MKLNKTIINMQTKNVELEVTLSNDVEIKEFMLATTDFLLSMSKKNKEQQTKYYFIINMDFSKNGK